VRWDDPKVAAQDRHCCARMKSVKQRNRDIHTLQETFCLCRLLRRCDLLRNTACFPTLERLLDQNFGSQLCGLASRSTNALRLSSRAMLCLRPTFCISRVSLPTVGISRIQNFCKVNSHRPPSPNDKMVREFLFNVLDCCRYFLETFSLRALGLSMFSVQYSTWQCAWYLERLERD
jgi:hypothetical protein